MSSDSELLDDENAILPADLDQRLGPRIDRPRPAPKRLRFKSVSEFCGEYTPLAYVVEGIVRSGSLYTLTAKTGAGKTAFNVILTLVVESGRDDILGRDVTRGRVAYLACENPDDIRMRFMIAAHQWGLHLDEITDRIVILDRCEKPEEVCAELKHAPEAIARPKAAPSPMSHRDRLIWPANAIAPWVISSLRVMVKNQPARSPMLRLYWRSTVG